MVVGHGLAPVGHHEVRIDLASPAKFLLRKGILEQVKQQHAADECVLGRFRFGRGRKVDGAQHSPANQFLLSMVLPFMRIGDGQEKGADQYGEGPLKMLHRGFSI